MPETGREPSQNQSANAPEKDGGQNSQEQGQLHEELKSLKAELANAQQKAAIYDVIDQKYRSDEAFRKNFDREWYGKREESSAQEYADPADQIRNELSRSKKEIEGLKQDLTGLRDTFVNTQVMGGRNGLNVKYEEEFQRMASEVGYEPGTEAYSILFDNAVRAGYEVARKFNMLNESGQADPLVKYNEHFMKEAFKTAYDKHKRAGFDTAWKRRQQILETKQKQSKPDELDQFFKKENLKTREGRARALEKAWKYKTRGQNFSIV